MKKKIPDSIVVAGHSDYELLSTIATEITIRAGGRNALADSFGKMLRQCIDDVIMTPKTGRRSYEELEKAEKSYIGTRVEIDLRSLLKLTKGKLDTVILGHDVDIKNTIGSNWMIPTEALDNICILVAADEVRALCYLGLIVAREEYLTASQNKDSKKSVSADGFANILWLLLDHPYPANFWRTLATEKIDAIFAGKSGNKRVMALFREVQNTPITRDIIEAVAQQKDFMRRIRSDDGKGTRDNLAREGLLLLSGHFDAPLIEKLKLPFCSQSEFISHKPIDDDEKDAARSAGIFI